VRSRSKARAWALRALYAREARGEAVTTGDIVGELLEGRNVGAETRNYMTALLRAVDRNRTRVDAELEGALTNWRLERLSAIDRAILRLAAAELLFIDDVPPLVSIQEAILLAERYGTAESPRFVNGVLDALRKRNEADSAEGERP
jgi:transcription antitermination protein NusB